MVENVIEVNDLEKNYGSLKAVAGISFEVKPGEVFSLLGPNGAGKTTTIEILEGLRERDGGDVKVLGLDPWKRGYELHRKLGVIPQGFRFFDYATPKEAVEYYAALFGVKVDADAILKRVLLDDVSNKWYRNLSGGQKQKYGLALSLVNDPELVFLDEPTTGLDPQARRAVWEVIRELKKDGRAVLLTTHYLQEAEELADRVAIMNLGQIITSGTPEEIIIKYGIGEKLVIKGSGDLATYLVQAGLKVDVSGKDEIAIRIEHEQDVVEAMAAIARSGFNWSDLRIQRETLEDIFVRLVGRTEETSVRLMA
ncbi:MAG TPA: ABC transporter ATP-binding protein [Conexivisphaerales archaeon]|nr:ABC transporter ATP-binding protein [Conexivisphaerales archaeon]